MAPPEGKPSIPPDIAKLYPLKKQFFVIRDKHVLKTDAKEKGDLQFARSRTFSADKSSTEVIAEAYYLADNDTLCALTWTTKDNLPAHAIFFNGEIDEVVGDDIKIGIMPIFQQGNPAIIRGVRFYLLDDKNTPLLYRDFMIEAQDDDKVTA